MTINDDRRVSEPESTIGAYLLSGPKVDDLDIERDRSLRREMNLDGFAPHWQSRSARRRGECARS